jgi:NitT/TauT family transport system substrate-binding protein
VLGKSAPLLANSLQSGQVSAIVGGPSDLVSLRSQGLEIRNLLPEEIGDFPANFCAMRGDRIEEMRPLMEAFFQAWARCVHAAEVDPEVVAAIARKAVPGNRLNEGLGLPLLDMGTMLHKPGEGVCGELRGEIWTSLQESLVAAGELDATVDNAAFLNDAFIQEADSFDRDAVVADVADWRAETCKRTLCPVTLRAAIGKLRLPRVFVAGSGAPQGLARPPISISTLSDRLSRLS